MVVHASLRRHPRPPSRGSIPSPIYGQTTGNHHGMDPRVRARGWRNV